MSDFTETFSHLCKRIDGYLQNCLQEDTIPENLRRAMEYSLLAGGKRIRPSLCLSSAMLFHADMEKCLPFAAAIELIHTYSLIHDDLPCMDDDDLRRGRPSNHKAFGEANALLAGDGLLTDAFWLMTKAHLDPSVLLAAISEIARAAGSSGMVGGQFLDMEATAREGISLSWLQHIHALKTGALLRASCTSGALLGGAHTADYNAMADFGTHLGIAFQIVDDILDEISDPETLGKPVHSDRDKSKTTYPLLVGLEKSRELAARELKDAHSSLSLLPENEWRSFLHDLAAYVVQRVN